MSATEHLLASGMHHQFGDVIEHHGLECEGGLVGSTVQQGPPPQCLNDLEDHSRPHGGMQIGGELRERYGLAFNREPERHVPFGRPVGAGRGDGSSISACGSIAVG